MSPEQRAKQHPSPDAERLALEEAVHQTLARINRKLMVLSGKGGVGKSTVAVNLAISLARRGHRVGLLDADLHGPSIPNLTGLAGSRFEMAGKLIAPVVFQKLVKVASMGFALRREEEAVIWRGPLKIAAMKQLIGQVDWGELDYLVIDAPPGTGDEPLTVAQVIPDALAVIVTTPQELSLADVRKAISFCRATGLEIGGVVENMSGLRCPHCGREIELFPSGGGERMALQMGVPFLGRLPIDPELVKACDQGRPPAYYDPEGRISKEFESVIEQLLARFPEISKRAT